MIIQALVVGLGGFVGAILRFLISGLVTTLMPAARIPWGTFSVNMLGCFAIGLLSASVETNWTVGAHTRALLFVGVLGSFTTFSTFAFESELILQEGHFWRAASYVSMHVVLGILLVILGRNLVLPG
ncbi:MAG: fluoride efflux transporter CrcB [Bdellovibrionales bacterium]|nr:fluoride efflux transporter CrcB [Bdellovibrionales bacterium]